MSLSLPEVAHWLCGLRLFFTRAVVHLCQAGIQSRIQVMRFFCTSLSFFLFLSISFSLRKPVLRLCFSCAGWVDDKSASTHGSAVLSVAVGQLRSRECQREASDWLKYPVLLAHSREAASLCVAASRKYVTSWHSLISDVSELICIFITTLSRVCQWKSGISE